MPVEVWRWSLKLLRAALHARPGAGHAAIARLDRALGERCRTITQNLDGLHVRAGNDPARTYTIHGDAAYVRCGADCSQGLVPRPPAVLAPEVDPAQDPALRCARCGALLRPHALLFDACYTEPLDRSESALAAAKRAALLLVVGTSGRRPCRTWWRSTRPGPGRRSST